MNLTYDLDLLIKDVERIAEGWNLYDNTTAFDQAHKAHEEVGELMLALHRGDKDATKDAIGDTLVCLINTARMENVSIHDCLAHAVLTISRRKGKMVDGKFVKENE
jgi:NTP pyrophosphatase (non-canonical NTP hydrolase)